MPTYRDDEHLGHKVPLVETDDIMSGAVTTDKLDDLAVTEPKLADNSVTERSVSSNTIATRHLQDRSVTEPKMADNSVSNRTVQDDAIGSRNLRPKVIKSHHMDDKAVTARTIGDDVIPTLIRPITDKLQQQIDSFNDHGMSVSNEFGNNEHISISQAALTKAVNAIWKKLAEITGEPTTGIALTVTPDYFISDDKCTVHISAEHETHVFEKIAFYADDELLAEAENVREYSCDATISKTCTIKCVATILGMEYTETKKVTKYFPFFIGCGTSWEDMINDKYARDYDGSLSGNYDIEVEKTGDRIYIITPASLEEDFNGAFMNGFEIPFQIINNTQYVIRESRNTYTKGIYNIDIN